MTKTTATTALMTVTFLDAFHYNQVANRVLVGVVVDIAYFLRFGVN